jgi:hypothetical protein
MEKNPARNVLQKKVQANLVKLDMFKFEIVDVFLGL